METCPFCYPHVGESTFAETAHFRALYNIAPILPGHSLIIPKKHILRFLEVNEDEIAEMVKFSRQVMHVLEVAFNTESFNWTVQEGKEAGQTLPHMHMHIIPRRKKDLAEPGDWYPKLIKDESEIIDSFYRQRHAPVEMQQIIRHLKEIYDSLYHSA